MLVYSVNDRKTFDAVKHTWLPLALQRRDVNRANTVLVLVGIQKEDNDAHRQVTSQAAREYAEMQGIHLCYEIRKENDGTIEKMIEATAKRLLSAATLAHGDTSHVTNNNDNDGGAAKSKSNAGPFLDRVKNAFGGHRLPRTSSRCEAGSEGNDVSGYSSGLSQFSSVDGHAISKDIANLTNDVTSLKAKQVELKQMLDTTHGCVNHLTAELHREDIELRHQAEVNRHNQETIEAHEEHLQHEDDEIQMLKKTVEYMKNEIRRIGDEHIVIDANAIITSRSWMIHEGNVLLLIYQLHETTYKITCIVCIRIYIYIIQACICMSHVHGNVPSGISSSAVVPGLRTNQKHKKSIACTSIMYG